MSRQLLIAVVGIALLALASTVIVRQAMQVDSLQARVLALESRVAEIGKLRIVPAESGK